MIISVFFFFKQKTAYELRISDWSSDVCSSDLLGEALLDADAERVRLVDRHFAEQLAQPRNDAVRNTLVEPGETHDRVAIIMHHLVDQMLVERSDERREGKECVGTCKTWGSPYH